MLHEATARVRVFGFRRCEAAPCAVDGAPAVDFGRTYDGALAQRALAAGAKACLAAGWGRALRDADVIMARNLEMLVIAAAARRLHAPRARLIYECLDIHRLMTAPGPAGMVLRSIERALLGEVQILVVSSSAFVRAYFEPWQRLGARISPPVLIVENRVFEPGEATPDETPRPPGPPWRIGWFGMLRCRQSFAELARLAKRAGGAVQVVLAGRPSPREFPDFAEQVAEAPGMSFIGDYAPADVGRLYRSVHFNWAIDHFQAGGNSQWLLPNRLYEGGRFGAVPLALAGGETARWLERRGLGLAVQDPVRDLGLFLGRLDVARYRQLEARCAKAPRNWFVADAADCRHLVQALASG